MGFSYQNTLFFVDGNYIQDEYIYTFNTTELLAAPLVSPSEIALEKCFCCSDAVAQYTPTDLNVQMISVCTILFHIFTKYFYSCKTLLHIHLKFLQSNFKFKY